MVKISTLQPVWLFCSQFFGVVNQEVIFHMMVFLALMVFGCCAAGYYVAAMKAGMNAKRWAVGGLLLGPALFPLFNMKRYLLWREIAGYRGPVFAA
ncbi:hypothetical protein [Alteromonas sp. RKMC-009]|uniref:hypothetical protein n=2 Tax=Alteromonas TaxID=226 RepID=UPI001E5A5CBF|nr:hypothetical protein [Alteromonas sp. RKMC-009]